MKPIKKTPETKVRTKKTTQDDIPSTKLDEKNKKSVYSVSTPRNYVPKSSTADIYAKKKQASKKLAATPRAMESPMKDLLKSSASQASLKSSKQKTVDSKVTPSPASRSTPKRLALSNVTVNSPVVKRRLNLEMGNSPVKNRNEIKEAGSSRHPSKVTLPGRQRTKTRTLEEDEVKILTPEAIDNNAAMQELSRTLTAQPKAFYVDLDDKPKNPKKVEAKQNSKSSDDDVSYEDDFESYESDFDSYHSEEKNDSTSAQSEETSGEDEDQTQKKDDGNGSEEPDLKEVKDEEKMLDSGNFELRESQRSASRKPAVMDFILEGTEDRADDKKVSLTDEGFQEMSHSSAVSSMKMVHTEVLERPLFIDFTQSKENKRKRKIFEKLKQRAKDILSMVTLHEMSYWLFEMKPIPYDLFMATFGRKNYTQIAIQTFEDGITQEVQTDDIMVENKWSQFPVKFSTADIITKHDNNDKKCDIKDEGLIFKFEYLLNRYADTENITVDEQYKTNPLRIFLEQKEGAGSDKMLSEEKYKAKLKNNEFNVNKLRKFLKKTERRLSSILSLNAGTDTSNLIKNSKLPFSKGYVNITARNITDEKLHFLKYTKITGVCFSETKENLVMTYHKKTSNSGTVVQYFICLWDTCVISSDPLKVLKATDGVQIGRYRGNTNGVFAAALEDRSLQLWDLSEEPTWRNDVSSLGDEKSTKLVEVDTSKMTEVEVDREWNLRNSQVGYEEKSQSIMQVSAYTNSAVNMTHKESVDNIVALEFIGEQRETNQDGGRKIVGKICTLQKLGILLIWSITQEQINTHDIGKAYWSKIILEKIHTLNLLEHVDAPIADTDNKFNLNAAKRRLANRKQDRAERRKDLTRPRSAILKNFDRSGSVASPRKDLPISRTVNAWDCPIICNHMKVLRLNKTDHYLVANGNGDVLCCKRSLNDFKVDCLCVASDKSPITRLEVTYSNLPYFLAATDSGTVNLCSILDARVLLTLDCRNGPPMMTVKCQADHKGRFIASVPQQSPADDVTLHCHSNLSVRSLSWSPADPFCIVALVASGAVVTWQLTHSDMNARSAVDCAAVAATSSRGSSLALLTKEGEVQIHRLFSENDNNSIDLFNKYVALL